MLYIGNHTSSSKGYAAMGRQIVKNGGNTFAFFTRNPRGGNAKAIDPADVAKFQEIAREHEFGKIVAHAPYTLNACAAKENLRDFARETFADDLKRMEATPGNYYNFHPGSHVGQGIEVIGSHDYYPRSTHGVFALLAAACAACLVQLNSKAFRRGLACLSACVGIVCGIHMLEAGYDIASYWMMDHVRTQTLRQEISELDEPAAANIISYGIEPYTKWCGAYGLPDIRENGEDSLALGRARWFGITSITATETRTYPFAGHTNETYAAGEAAAENAESMD